MIPANEEQNTKLDGFLEPKRVSSSKIKPPSTNIKVKSKNKFTILEQNLQVNSGSESSLGSSEGEIDEITIQLNNEQLDAMEGYQSSIWQENLDKIMEIATYTANRRKKKGGHCRD